jgi:hypothetical protein
VADPAHQATRTLSDTAWLASLSAALTPFSILKSNHSEKKILSGLLADKGGATQISTALPEPTISGLEISTDV